VSTFSRDLSFAVRSLRSSPAFAATAILTLALGIGASTAIFSVVNAALLRPLPYKDPEGLVLVWGDMRNRNVTDFPFAPANFQDLKNRATAFQDLAGVSTFRAPLGGDGNEPEQVKVANVTINLFSLLGSRIVAGRDFIPSDGAPPPPPPQGAAPGAAPRQPPLPAMLILSYEFWQRRYGGDKNVIGKTFEIFGQPAQIVGVVEPNVELLLPAGTGVETKPDLYLAGRIDFADQSLANRINVFLRVIGRLRPGATVGQAQRQVDAVAADLRDRFTIIKSAGTYFRVEPMHDDLVADVRPAMRALMGAVMFVLLIACANVANLLLVRAGGRERELAVRAALGGSSWHLVRQMLLESVVLGVTGAAIGLGLALLGIKVLGMVAPANLPRLDAVQIDLTVLAFTTIAALTAALVFGLVPAIRSSRPDLMDVLRQSGRTGGLRSGTILRSGVVALEVALSFVLLIGCGLMLRSFVALQRVDPGFDPKNALTFYLTPRAQTPDERGAFVRTLQSRLKALPGVTGVTAVSPLPLDGQVVNMRWGKEDAATDPTKFQQANLHTVVPGYFGVMRTHIIAGRDYDERDMNPNALVIIIDDMLAARAFPGENPVGKRLLMRIDKPQPEWREVIGVVRHERHDGLATEGRMAVFVADGYLGNGAVNRWVVRTSGDPIRLTGQVRALIKEIDPNLAPADVQPFQAFVDRASAGTRFALTLISVFAGIAAILAAVGLYGVLATVVRQRTPEIGVRLAFGAQTRSIFGLIVGQGLKLSGIGLAAGLVGALLLTRVMTSMLVGVAPTDPLTYGVMILVFAVIAFAASWVPARRAATLDPMVALREE
jgi:putative ABC transport system permease protein